MEQVWWFLLGLSFLSEVTKGPGCDASPRQAAQERALAGWLRCGCYFWPQSPSGKGLVLTTGHLPTCILAEEDGAELESGEQHQPEGAGCSLDAPLHLGSQSRVWTGHQALEWASLAQVLPLGMSPLWSKHHCDFL